MSGANTTGSTALLPWIQGVCASERRLEAHLADLKQLEEGSLHIVAFTSTLTQWLPQITKRFTEAHPHINLRITCCDDQAQLEHIVESGQAQKSSETASGAARAFIECTKGWIREAYEREPEALLI